MRWKLGGALLCLAIVLPAARGDVKPHALCQDGMVLQQKSKVKVWGTADPGEAVTVEFRGEKATAKADEKGHWIVAIGSGAAGGPFPMTIAGKNKLDYTDVLVGEVWVASGQSNMQWAVNQCDQTDKESAIKSPHNPNLRMFQVQRVPHIKPTDDVIGKWEHAKPETVPAFSATGYFFGRDLQHAIKIPVGIIHTSWGGTRAEAWTSKEVLDKHPGFKFEHENFAKSLEAYSKDTKGQKNPLGPNSPSALYNGMIYPILNTTIKGAIWYQGESNAGKAYAYRTLFPMMIENWRKDFKQGDFPFYWVQLAPFLPVKKDPSDSNWAELREAQSMTLKLPNSGQAVITDLGNEYDIHPTPKRPVGERLSKIARAQVYGEKLVYSGPVYKSLKVEGSNAVLNFDHVGGGLVGLELVPTLVRDGKPGAAWRTNGKEGSLVGFTVCGEDKKFYPAKATIQGDTVVVGSDAVARPMAVRYGWADHPVANLFNKEGLPASPFRTDDFPAITAPKQ